ncbi:MAG: hypothetical protein IKL79_03535 [Clostridia bacterium]|nr:hypothetical protein [Clostridia bacterium]
MGRLFIVAGAAGQGKKFFFDKFNHLIGVELIKKLTTRKNGTNDDLIPGQSESDIDRKCQYKYRYGDDNDYYGIEKIDIDNKLAENKNPLVIVRKGEVIRKMKADYPDAICINVQSCLGADEYLAKMAEKNWTDIDIHARMRRAEADFEEYRKCIDVFDFNILNRFDDTINTQIQHVVSQIKPINRNNIFVVMPFAEKYNGVYTAMTNANGVIKNNSNPNIRIYRMSSEYGSYRITERIYQAIDEAAIIICEATEADKPNVYYEFGYAKAKNKEIFVLVRKNHDENAVRENVQDGENGNVKSVPKSIHQKFIKSVKEDAATNNRIKLIEYEDENELFQLLVDAIEEKLGILK